MSKNTLVPMLLALCVGCSSGAKAPEVSEAPKADPSKNQLPINASRAPACAASPKFTLVVHGGVGYVANEAQSEYLMKIIGEGRDLLKAGHSSVDVVQHVVEGLESSCLFNAGCAGTRTSLKTVELDASIMDGSDLKAGAVASVKDVKNPIRLARAVKDQTRHLLMVGDGASRLADEFGFEKVEPSYFVGAQLEQSKPHFGTVGAVALDRCGTLAAATSTGGLTGKRPGRVGDSPIIGAGTYANNKTCAVSATGEGEKFIRANVASRVSNILEYTKRDLKSAVEESLRLVEKLEGSGGLIALSKSGEPYWSTTKTDPKTKGLEPMPGGSVREDGVIVPRDLAKK